VTLQVPMLTPYTYACPRTVLTVHTEVVVDAKVTVSPDEAVALSPSFWPASQLNNGLKVIVWPAVGPICGVTAILWPGAAARAAGFEAAPDQAAIGSAKVATATIRTVLDMNHSSDDRVSRKRSVVRNSALRFRTAL
jgi:hypothetical protein